MKIDYRQKFAYDEDSSLVLGEIFLLKFINKLKTYLLNNAQHVS